MPHRILLVDHDPRFLRATADLLSARGHAVECASTFDDAKRQLTQAVPDLLITDLQLGAFNGLHLVLRARMNRPSMPAIVTTREPNAAVEHATHELNARYQVKPIRPEEMDDAVRESLDGRDPQGWGGRRAA